MNKRFGVRWGRPLKMMTIFSLAICIGIPVTSINRLTYVGGNNWAIYLLFLPILIVIAAAFFMILGYGISDTQIIIYHLGWKRTFEIADLTKAVHEPYTTAGSIRTWGNGGMFSFSGYFRSNHLGAYRAYMTHAEDAVILYFGNDNKVVISPDDPEKFVEALSAPVL